MVTDQILSPADFQLHRMLASHFKDNKNAIGYVLSVSESYSRWKAIASRANVNIETLVQSQSLRFLDLVPDLRSSTSPQESLRSSIRELRSLLQQQRHDVTGPSLVILDDISSLEWIGYPTDDLSQFCRALVALARKYNSPLVIRHHITTADAPDDLYRLLLQLCTYHIDVRPLSTGRSGAVSGEISLQSGPSNAATRVKTIPGHRAVQYRLTDTAAVYFEKGTGQVVL